MACLQWALDNPNARQIIKDYERFGQEIPEDLVPPAMNDIETFFWQAFWDLSTERQVSMQGGLPIPRSVIQRYGVENYGPGPEFIEVIRKMDAAYLNYKEGASRTFSREMFKR